MSKIQADSAQDQRLAQAERLVQLRRDKGLTAEQLAQAMTKAGAKVSRGAISNWERGINGIVSSKLPTLAHILGCTEGYLLRGDSAHKTSSNNNINNNTIRQSSSKSAATLTSSADTNQNPRSSSTYLNNTADTTVYQVKDGTTMTELKKSEKLQNVCYDIRGPLLKTANKMEAEGQRILKLNVGNPAPFGLEAPHEILRDVAMNLPEATGYSDSQGIFSARKAVLQYYQSKGLLSAVDVRDVYLGNGVS